MISTRRFLACSPPPPTTLLWRCQSGIAFRVGGSCLTLVPELGGNDDIEVDFSLANFGLLFFPGPDRRYGRWRSAEPATRLQLLPSLWATMLLGLCRHHSDVLDLDTKIRLPFPFHVGSPPKRPGTIAIGGARVSCGWTWPPTGSCFRLKTPHVHTRCNQQRDGDEGDQVSVPGGPRGVFPARVGSGDRRPGAPSNCHNPRPPPPGRPTTPSDRPASAAVATAAGSTMPVVPARV